MRNRAINLAIAVAVALTAMLAGVRVAAFPAVDERTAGPVAMRYDSKSQVWGAVDAGATDGRIVASPSNAATLDRRLEVRGDAVADIALGPRAAVRLSAKSTMVRRRMLQEGDASVVTDSTATEAEPAADLTYITSKGLELFGGAGVHFWQPYDARVESAAGVTTIHHGAARLLMRRFGLVRRSGGVDGGMHFIKGGQTERSLTADVYDGSEVDGSDVVVVPSRFGVFGVVKAGSTAWDFGADFVQARGLGPEDDRGNTPYGDWFEARFAALFKAAGLGLRLGVFHKTMSYARSSFVTLDTIPVTGLVAGLWVGDGVRGAHIGMTAARGVDGQSQPEFNADYDLKAVAITAGLGLGF